MFAAGIGSVVKPVDGPTGWHVIGKSPLKQWLPEKDPPLLILAGDRVRFQPVTEEEYQPSKTGRCRNVCSPNDRDMRRERMCCRKKMA